MKQIHSIFFQRLQCYYHNVTIRHPFDSLQLMSKAAKCGAIAVAKVLDLHIHTHVNMSNDPSINPKVLPF